LQTYLYQDCTAYVPIAVALFVKYIFLLPAGTTLLLKYIFLRPARTTLFVKYIFLRPAKTAVGRTFPVLCGTFHKNTFFFVLQKQPLGALFPYSVALFIKIHFSSSRETNFTVASVPDIHFYSSRLKIAVFQHFFALFALF
jgi:hypothetical protein